KKEKRDFQFVYEEFTYKHSAPDYIDVFSCQLSTINNRSCLNCNMILRRNIEKIILDASFEMLKPNNQTMRLFHINMDGCQFFASFHKTRLLRMFAKSLASTIHGSLKCPIISQFNYSITNWHLNESDFPNYVPESRLLFYITLYINSKVALKTKSRFSVVYK
ncbi:hypothetical protein KR215_003646, partial [Drosophila sulfurigaster]